MPEHIEYVLAQDVAALDLTQLELLVSQNTEKLNKISDLLLHVYSAQLFVIGVVAACVVSFLLYRFIRQFY